MSTVIKFSLSEKSIKKAIADLEKYKHDIQKKNREFVRKLAENGLTIAQGYIGSYDAIDSGNLSSSIMIKQSDSESDTWYVYTDCPYAKFVEFGTGLVGKNNPHPNVIDGYVYDSHGHEESGWVYFKDGMFHWTQGYFSRPFMYMTALELRSIVDTVGKEVFG